MTALSARVTRSTPDRVWLGHPDPETLPQPALDPPGPAPVEVVICPPSHRHGETMTCYAHHGCRCSACRAKNSSRNRSPRKPVPAAERRADQGVKEALAPHGTIGAARSHIRRGEPMCETCRVADRAYRRRHAELQQQRELEATMPSVSTELNAEETADEVVIRASAADARLIAAALLDRAINMEPNRYTAVADGRTFLAKKETTQKLRLLHHAVAKAARALEADEDDGPAEA